MGGCAPRLTIGAAMLAGSLSCGARGFLCSSDGQCGADGRCESQGYCSFPDPACASGRRFGGHAAANLADQCVEPVGGVDDGVTHDSGIDPGSTAGDDDLVPDGSGPSPSSGASAGSGETGPSELCGDGTLDPPEVCDDGNLVDGDGCNADCRPSGELLWELLDAGDGGAGARDLAISGDELVLAGYTITAAGQRGLVQAFDPSGAELWRVVDDGADVPGEQLGWGIASAPDGAWIAVSATSGGSTGRLLVVDEGLLTSATTLDGVLYDVAVAEDGTIYVAGRDAAGAPLVLAIEGNGPPLPVDLGDTLGTAVAWDLGVSGTRVWVEGTQPDAAGDRGWIRTFDRDSLLVTVVPIPDRDAGLTAYYGLDVRGDRVATCGNRVADGANLTAFARFSAPDQPDFAGVVEALGPANAHDVAIGPAGELALVGWTSEAADLVVSKIDPDGEIVWTHVHAGAAGLSDNGYGVALGEDGRVYVAGQEVDDAGPQIWLAAFSP